MILFRAILILMLSSVVIRLSAYPGPPRFAHLSLNEGVSNNLVYAMAQDHHGFMWFGTLYGLVRYDGYRYEVFQHDPQDPASISFD
ncbi:MAG TPA: two-component regulator propeller domain-containing protein, partial [Calditrichia bacterium]|nr:two-component regulator propeller domain-containing protein [Calditrichia bacterium]